MSTWNTHPVHPSSAPSCCGSLYLPFGSLCKKIETESRATERLGDTSERKYVQSERKVRGSQRFGVRESGERVACALAEALPRFVEGFPRRDEVGQGERTAEGLFGSSEHGAAQRQQGGGRGRGESLLRRKEDERNFGFRENQHRRDGKKRL